MLFPHFFFLSQLSLGLPAFLFLHAILHAMLFVEFGQLAFFSHFQTIRFLFELLIMKSFRSVNGRRYTSVSLAKLASSCRTSVLPQSQATGGTDRRRRRRHLSTE